MIVDLHVLTDKENAKAVRDFLIDVLEYPFIDPDFWLIPVLTPSELGVRSGVEFDPHEVYLMSDDLKASVKELEGKGVEFTGPISETSFGYVTSIKLPGGGEMAMCQQKDDAVQPSA